MEQDALHRKQTVYSVNLPDRGIVFLFQAKCEAEEFRAYMASEYKREDAYVMAQPVYIKAKDMILHHEKCRT